MASSWEPSKLDDYLSFKNGKTSPERTENGSKSVFGSNGVIGFSTESNAPEDSLIIGRVGTYCGSVYHTKDDCWVTDNAISCVPKQDDESEFWYFKLVDLNLNNQRSGSGQPLLNQSILKSIETNIPVSHEVRRKIGQYLMTFNNKIELNRHTNQILEQMAQNLFKSWFVDFDPVIDNALDGGNLIPKELQAKAEQRKAVKADGDFKPLPDDIRQLFPSEFEESELGWVPKGWRVNRLDDALELAYGKSLKKSDRIEGIVPVYGSGGVNGTHNEKLVPGPGIIVGRKGTVGSLYWESNDFFPIDTVFYVKPREGYSLSYLYQLLQTLGLEGMNTDAAVPGLNRNNAYRLLFASPAKEIMRLYTKCCLNFQIKIDLNTIQNTTLSSTRNILLPNLISGKLKLTGNR